MKRGKIDKTLPTLLAFYVKMYYHHKQTNKKKTRIFKSTIGKELISFMF